MGEQSLTDRPENANAGNIQARAEAAALLADARAMLKALTASLPSDNPLVAEARGAVAQIAAMASDPNVTAAQIAAVMATIPSVDASALRGGGSDKDLMESMLAVADAANAAREQVQDLSKDLYERDIFKNYLRFKEGTNDEKEYRGRKADNEKYIKDELKKETPEGTLNANGRMHTQLLDDNTHGAGNSPEFMERWDKLAESTKKLRAELVAAGKSTKEFDDKLKKDVSDFLKDKGLSQDEIDQKLKGTVDPLDIARPYLTKDVDGLDLVRDIHKDDRFARSELNSPKSKNAGSVDIYEGPVDFNRASINAKLESAGLPQLSENNSAVAEGHGLGPSTKSPGIASSPPL